MAYLMPQNSDMSCCERLNMNVSHTKLPLTSLTSLTSMQCSCRHLQRSSQDKGQKSSETESSPQKCSQKIELNSGQHVNNPLPDYVANLFRLNDPNQVIKDVTNIPETYQESNQEACQETCQDQAGFATEHNNDINTNDTNTTKHLTVCDKILDTSRSTSKTVGDLCLHQLILHKNIPDSTLGSSVNSKTHGVDSRPSLNSSPTRLLTDMSFNIFQVLKVALILIVMDFLAVQGQSLGPHYKVRRICVSDDECNTDIGEVCWWAWDGCDTGQCMCDPRTSFYDSTLNYCRPLKYGDERCEAGDRCWEGMSCRDGYCQCDQGLMTSDKMFCLRDHERFLGQQCLRHSHICYQRTALGYARKDTHCSHEGRCNCNRGFKEDGYACRKWNVNEVGCHKDHHCQGGALCIDNKCQCPSRYRTVARNSKCARYGAKYDLQLGEVCDEINERGYCAYGLVCHRCPSEVVHKCVRFMEAEALPYRYSSSSHPQTSLLITMTTVFTINVFIR